MGFIQHHDWPALIMLAALILVLLALSDFCRRNPRRRLKSGHLLFWVEGEPMNTADLKPGQSVPYTIDFKGLGGEAEQPASPPTATSSAPGVATVTANPDGMSGVVTYVSPGAAVITIVAEGDPTPGADTVTLQGTVTCKNPEIASGEIVFGTPTP